MTPSRPSLRCSLTIVAAITSSLFLQTSNAGAQFGGYGRMRGMQRMSQQQIKFMQDQMKAAQEQEKAKQDAFMKRFDTNKNGKIDGKEKGPAQKYLRQLELGKDPDKAMKTMGRPSGSSRSKRAKPTTAE